MGCKTNAQNQESDYVDAITKLAVNFLKLVDYINQY